MQAVKDVMTRNPIALPPTASALEAAKLMKEHAIGNVLVCEDDKLCGIVTDRDLAIRCVADGGSTAEPIGDFCSKDVLTVSPDDDVAHAIETMKEHAIRRVPVIERGQLVGVLSLGDLAQVQEPTSVLGEISAAPPNQ